MKKKKYFPWLLIPVLFCALALFVMLLWNAILPGILPVGKVTYFQALGLLILFRILFGNFGGWRGKPRFGGPPPHMREKWMNMSEEDKMKIREEWRRRCGRR